MQTQIASSHLLRQKATLLRLPLMDLSTSIGQQNLFHPSEVAMIQAAKATAIDLMTDRENQ